MWVEEWRTGLSGMTQVEAVKRFVAYLCSERSSAPRDWRWTTEAEGKFMLAGGILPWRVRREDGWWTFEWWRNGGK